MQSKHLFIIYLLKLKMQFKHLQLPAILLTHDICNIAGDFFFFLTDCPLYGKFIVPRVPSI